MPVDHENKQIALGFLEKVNNGEIKGVGKILGGTAGGLAGGLGGIIIGETLGDAAETLIKAGVRVWTNHRNLEQDARLAEDARRHEAEIEKNRQDFQRSLYREYAEDQKELAARNHRYRMEEQKQQFSIEDHKAFLSRWPLDCLPHVIRWAQSGTETEMPLHVICAAADDPFFMERIYPVLASELLDFTNLYPNEFHSSNLIFYCGRYEKSAVGGSINQNIRYILHELPVVILETKVIYNEIKLYLTMWGLGCSKMYQTSVCKFPYDPNAEEDIQQELTDALLAVMKFLAGYAYDVYNLMEFARVPLFADIVRLERVQSVPGCVLNYPQMIPVVGNLYEGLYDQALAGLSAEDTAALVPAKSRQTVLHRLRLDYAKKVRLWICEETYLRYLQESLDAWVYLRSEKKTEKFMEYLCANRYTVTEKYFEDEDKVYFKELCEAYPDGAVNGFVKTMTEWLFCTPEETARAIGEFRSREAEKFRKKAETEMTMEGMRAEYVFECYRKSAGFGDPVSALIVGFLYQYGIGTEPDLEKAEDFYRLSAGLGNRDAENNWLNFCRYRLNCAEEAKVREQFDRNSCGMSFDLFRWCFMIADTGNADFGYRLGKSFRPEFHKLFHDWYRKKADHGDAAAQFVMGCCYEKDIYHIPVKKAETWYEKVYDIEELYDPYEDAFRIRDRKTGKTYDSNVSRNELSYDLVKKTGYVDAEPDDLPEQAAAYYEKAAAQGLAIAAERRKALC